jgi:hypothetical protein
LYAIVEEAMVKRWTTRGRKSLVGTHDAFLLALLWLKNYSRFVDVERSFGLKENTTEDTIMRTLKTIGGPLCEKLIVPIKRRTQLAQGEGLFLSLGISSPGYPQVSLILDCSFQMSNKMGSNFGERKLFFSGKHHVHGIKREYAHLPNGKFDLLTDY